MEVVSLVWHILKAIQSYKQVTYQPSETLEPQPVNAITGIVDDLWWVLYFILLFNPVYLNAWIWPHARLLYM